MPVEDVLDPARVLIEKENFAPEVEGVPKVVVVAQPKHQKLLGA